MCYTNKKNDEGKSYVRVKSQNLCHTSLEIIYMRELNPTDIHTKNMGARANFTIMRVLYCVRKKKHIPVTCKAERNALVSDETTVSACFLFVFLPFLWTC